MSLLRQLMPKLYADAVSSVSLSQLRKYGITNLVIDLDNTLTRWNENEISDEASRWLQEAKRMNFDICIVSNSRRRRRVAAIADSIGVHHVTPMTESRSQGFKPLLAELKALWLTIMRSKHPQFKRAIGLLGARPEATAAIGDQYFRDVLGGNRLGMFTIKVKPISKNEFFGTRLVRVAERLLEFFLRWERGQD